MAVTPTYLEGFEDGVAQAAVGEWSLIASAGSSNLIAGRTGTNALELRGSTGGGSDRRSIRLTPVVAMPSPRCHVAVAIRPINTLGHDWGSEAHVAIGGANVALTIESDGSINVRSGTGRSGTILGSAPSGSAQVGQWVWVELATEEGTPGRVIFTVGSTQHVDNSTATIGAATWVGLSTGSAGGKFYAFDDLVIGEPAAVTDTYGPVGVYPLDLQSTSSAQGTGSDADQIDNHLLVDESTISTADYVDLSSGQRDDYTLSNLGFTTGNVLGVQARLSAERTQAGSITTSPIMKVGTDEETLPAQEPPNGSVAHLTYTVAAKKPRGSTTFVGNGTRSSTAPDIHASTQEDDFLILVICNRKDSGAPSALPGGWNEIIYSSLGGADVAYVRVGWRLATSSDAGTTVTLGSSEDAAWVATYRGLDQDILHTTATEATGDPNSTPPQQTATHPVLAFSACASSQAATPSLQTAQGFTLRDAGNNGGFADKSITASGTVVFPTWTGNNNCTTVGILLNPDGQWTITDINNLELGVSAT